MESKRRIHWVAPATMVSALLVGFLFSLGHHLFYASLDGKPAPTVQYSVAGTVISQQQMNTAVGNTFAFLVKAALILAVTVAYIQAFWRFAKTSRKGLNLSTIDTTFSSMGYFIGLTKAHVLAKFPLLFLLAAIAWIVPIASLVTPATLSIRGMLIHPSPWRMAKVPKFDFTKYDFAAPLTLGDEAASLVNVTQYCYRGPSRLVQRITAAVGSQGQILPISPPQGSLNATWSSQFWGPSLQCSSVEGQDQDDIWENVWGALNDTSTCSNSWGYLAWAPTKDNFMPFVRLNGSWAVQSGSLTTGSDAVLYVAALPAMFNASVFMPSHVIPGGCTPLYTSSDMNYPYSAAKDTGIFDGTLLRCLMLNTSYSAHFDYVDGAQTIHVDKLAYSDPPYVVPANCVTGPMAASNGILDYNGSLHEQADKSCSTLNQDGVRCSFQPSLLRTLSYQSIADAFGQLIQGTIGLTATNQPNPAVSINSAISRTILLDTDELAFTQNWTAVGFIDIAQLSADSNGSDYAGLSQTRNFHSRGPLSRALENLFQNITISMLSEPYLLPNYTSPYAPNPESNVTFNSWQNVYVYSDKTLWLAYGLAIAVSLIAVIVGGIVMLANGASYDNNFSTLLRIARAAEMSEELEGKEGEGWQPLPKRLEKVRVLMNNRGQRMSEKPSIGSGPPAVGSSDASSTAHSSLLPDEELGGMGHADVERLDR